MKINKECNQFITFKSGFLTRLIDFYLIRFVHGTCDPEADIIVYQQRKETHPEYEYVCLICKSLTQQNRQLMAKRNSKYIKLLSTCIYPNGKQSSESIKQQC